MDEISLNAHAGEEEDEGDEYDTAVETDEEGDEIALDKPPSLKKRLICGSFDMRGVVAANPAIGISDGINSIRYGSTRRIEE